MVGGAYAKKLKKLEIETVKDLLFHTPRRFLDFSHTSEINKLKVGEFFTIKANVVSAINQFSKRGVKMQLVNLQDKTGKIQAIWFNQPYLLSAFKKGSEVYIAGKLDFFGRTPAFVSPEYELVKSTNSGLHTGRLVPIYPETSGVSSKWLRSRISAAFKVLDKKDDYLPKEIKSKYKLEDLYPAIRNSHLPESIDQQKKAVRRLGFDEMFMLQLVNQKNKLKRKKRVSYKFVLNQKLLDAFINSLPFKLTDSQSKAIVEICSDINKPTQMNRLLQGDVGSGKTVVAAAAALIAHHNNFKSIFMAPTQILATQHFNTLKSTFKKQGIKIALLTSSSQLGDIKSANVIVGTHSLIFKKKIGKVGLLVIDEQHRFGVGQRTKLIKITKDGSRFPHVLNMTATPIPRTAALTFYGDQDISTLDELPKGRKKITTWIVPENKRLGAYGWIKEKITNEKVQTYIVCPLIEESEKESVAQIKAAKSEYTKLEKYFGKKVSLGLLHGKLKAKEKNAILKDFKNGKTDILVTTPVIEVGIDVPNATVMLIEGSENFGLAQLHQLRGRIGRGDAKSYCLLFTTNDNAENPRLEAMANTASGFKLAELDLKLRGPGEIYGLRQHGFPKLKNADWSDFKLVRQAKKAAELLVSSDKLSSELHSHYLFDNTK